MHTSPPLTTWFLRCLPLLIPGLAAGAAEWGELHHAGGAIADLGSPSLAFVTPDRALLVGVRAHDGRQRVFAARYSAGLWSPQDDGQPVDGAVEGTVSRPEVAADGMGGAILVLNRFDGTRWRLFARRYDGTGWADLNGGAPVDHPGAGGSVLESAMTVTTRGTVLTLFTQFDGTRAALLGGVQVNGAWSWLAEGEGIMPGAEPGGSSLPALAADETGGAVAAYVREVATGPRLFALRWTGSGWERLDGGLPLDRADLGGVRGTAVAPLPGGRLLVAYLQEDVTGTPRLFGLIRSGAAWIRINDGAPLDTGPGGVVSLSAGSAGPHGAVIAFVEAGSEPHVRSIRIAGATALPMNAGVPLEAPGAGAASRPALAGTILNGGALLLMAIPQSNESGTRSFARDLAVPAPLPAAPRTAAGDWGVRVTDAVFKPGHGGRAGITVWTRTPQRLRVAIHGLAGGAGQVLRDGVASGGASLEWNGRDNSGRPVAPGTYLLVVTGDTFREVRRVVVIR